jgi:hypothetical protein
MTILNISVKSKNDLMLKWKKTCHRVPLSSINECKSYKGVSFIL